MPRRHTRGHRCTIRLTARASSAGLFLAASGARLRPLVKSHPLFFLLLIAVPIVEYIAGVRGGPGPSLAVVRNPFAAIALASVFCRYIMYDRTGRTRKWIVYLTPLAWGAVLRRRGAPGTNAAAMAGHAVRARSPGRVWISGGGCRGARCRGEIALHRPVVECAALPARRVDGVLRPVVHASGQPGVRRTHLRVRRNPRFPVLHPRRAVVPPAAPVQRAGDRLLRHARPGDDCCGRRAG